MLKLIALTLFVAVSACARTPSHETKQSPIDRTALLIGKWNCTEAEGHVKVVAEFLSSGQATTLTELQADRNGAAMILRLLVDSTWRWTPGGLLERKNTKARVLPVLLDGQETTVSVPDEMLALIEGETTLYSMSLSANQMRQTDSRGVIRACSR